MYRVSDTVSPMAKKKPALARLRKSKKLTQEALAAMAGTSQVTISELESGQTLEPKFSTAVRLARALEVQPEVLFPVGLGK